MNKLYILIFMFFGSICFGEDKIKEIPSIYIRPVLYNSLYNHPPVLKNGYVLVEDIETAKKFFDTLPPDANFDKEDVIIFAWNGSEDDKVDYSLDEETYHFVYKRGVSKNNIQHFKIVVLPKKNDWLFHRVLD